MAELRTPDLQVFDKNLSFRLAPFPILNHQVATVIGDRGTKSPLGLIGSSQNQSVLVLIVAEFVKIELLIFIGAGQFRTFGWFVIASVKETTAVRRPGDIAELHPSHQVLEIPARGDVADLPCSPIAAAIGQSVSQQLAVVGDDRVATATVPSSLSLLGSSSTSRSIERIGFVKDALVLKSIIVRVEVTGSSSAGQFIPFVVPQSLQSACISARSGIDVK